MSKEIKLKGFEKDPDVSDTERRDRGHGQRVFSREPLLLRLRSMGLKEEAGEDQVIEGSHVHRTERYMQGYGIVTYQKQNGIEVPVRRDLGIK